MKIKNILWDINGVLIQDLYELLYKEISKDIKMDFYDFMESIRSDEILMETGKFNEEQLINILNEKYKLKEYNIDLKEYFKKGFVKNEEIFNIIDNLNKKNISNHLISNIGSQGANYLQKELEFDKHFKMQFLSCNIFMRKPDLEIFYHALNELKAKPNEILFIDDKKRNTDSAKTIGINTITYTDNTNLKKELAIYLK